MSDWRRPGNIRCRRDTLQGLQASKLWLLPNPYQAIRITENMHSGWRWPQVRAAPSSHQPWQAVERGAHTARCQTHQDQLLPPGTGLQALEWWCNVVKTSLPGLTNQLNASQQPAWAPRGPAGSGWGPGGVCHPGWPPRRKPAAALVEEHACNGKQ